MSWKTGCLCGLLAVAGTAPAANPGDRPVKLSNEQEALTFAHQLHSLTQAVAGQYVKEVAQEDLLAAALRGLYDAARQEFPAEVVDALKEAKTDKDKYAVIIGARRRLGDDPALAGSKALFVGAQSLSRVLDAHCMLVPSTDFQSSFEYQAGYGFDLDGEAGAPNAARRTVPASGFAAAPMTPPVPFRVTRVYPGGPAQRAGMRPGDIITHIDGKKVTADLADAIYNGILRAPDELVIPKETSFTVLRAGRAEPLKLAAGRRSFTPESVYGVRRLEDNSWRCWLEEQEKIACVRVGAIDHNTPSQVAEALNSLRDAKGLILDLRWCPGGFLNQSAEVASLFLEDGKIASVKYRQPDRQGPGEFKADGFGLRRQRFKDVPLVVLVNGDTSGGGELIAAALQDNGRAKVAGQRTLGKASIQSPIYLSGVPNWSFKLSAGTFVRPSGKNLQRYSGSKPEDDWGVRPDKGYEIPVSDSLGRRLKDWHQDYVLRPPDSRDALPLDDPDADPQRRRAAALLKKLIETK